MEGNSTNALRDYSGRGINITRSQALWNQSGGYDGKGAFLYNGSSCSNITASGNILPINNYPISISFWMKPQYISTNNINSTQNNAGKILTFHRTTSVDSTLSIGVGNSSLVQFYNYNNSVTYNWTNTIATNNWYFITLTYNGTHFQKYYNGVADGTPININLTQANVSMQTNLGCHNNAGGYFNGTLDDVRIYNYTLIPQQILLLYQNISNLWLGNQTVVGDTWQCKVTPFSNETVGALYSSNIITISTVNLYVASYLNATTIGNLTVDNLTCYYGNAIGTVNTTAINWYKNGTSIMKLYLPMEGNSTNARIDYSENSHTATCAACPVWSSTGGYDKKGAFAFTAASSQYFNTGTGNHQIKGALPRTICAWANTTTFNDAGIFQAGPTGTGGADFSFRTLTTTNNWRAQFWGGDDFDVVLTGSANAWHHYCLSYNGTTSILYYDGKLNYSKNMNLNTGSTDVLVGSWGGFYFGGSIDDVRIYDTALSLIQINALYNNRSDLIVANETNAGDSWQCKVIPFNSTYAGAPIVISNTVVINDVCEQYNGGNWNFNCSKNCSYYLSHNLLNNNISFTGNGSVKLYSTITNISWIDINKNAKTSSCWVYVYTSTNGLLQLGK
jgi:hypothetical protein